MAVPRSDGPLEHRAFRDLPELMAAGDVLVVNESLVLPARLLGMKPTGARAEVLLLRPTRRTGDGNAGGLDATAGNAPDAVDASLWEALVRPGGKLKPGRTVEVAPNLVVHILDSTPDNGRIVRLETPLAVEEALARYGHVPLPPYLRRADEPIDRDRYQTVYARVPGSVAAPTAGLHFTPELIRLIEGRGVRIAKITLHVGVGTFRPVEVERPEDHTLHIERFEIPESTAKAVSGARARGGRVWAVGTTVVRTLESAVDTDGTVSPGCGSTDLFIRPPFDFRVVDALVTNFHLPRSTLLMLVAAFGGYDRTMEAYREAVSGGYRFYSYGDAMVVS